MPLKYSCLIETSNRIRFVYLTMFSFIDKCLLTLFHDKDEQSQSTEMGTFFIFLFFILMGLFGSGENNNLLLVDIAFDHVNHRVEVHVTLNRYVDSFLE